MRLLASEDTREQAFAAWKAAGQNVAITEKTVKEAIAQVTPEGRPEPVDPTPALDEMHRGLVALLDLLDRAHYRTGLTSELRDTLRDGCVTALDVIRHALKTL